MQRKVTGTWNDDPAHFRKVTRRDFLHVGFAGGIGLTLADFFRLQAAQGEKPGQAKEGKAKSLIHIFMPGGMAHQESFDPKPFAPIEYRGEMTPIKTKIEGVYFNECLKQTADLADKITILLNGTVVNVGTKCSHTKGKILFQSEGAEVFFRRIDLEPLR